MNAVLVVMKSVPLLCFAVIAYFLVAMGGVEKLDGSLMSITLASRAPWKLLTKDFIAIFGLTLLFIEILKSTRTSVASIIDHALSLVLFTGGIILFVISPKAGTSTFFILIMMSLIDVIAGFTITISGTRRDISVEK
ncbi:conserved membrane hypothetical protein [Azospirillaceae bacterium]